MKNLNSILIAIFLIVILVSCANNDRDQRYVAVDAYEAYIDSISNVGMQNVSDRWNEIEYTVREKRSEAENQLNTIEDDDNQKSMYQQKVYSTNERYDDFRNQVLTERERLETASVNQNLRNSLFRNGSIGDNRNFNWVNKDNILATYEHFVSTVSNNKDNYTREEWDEIKMLYEALDSRKNTVENEGLSPEDNRKIAALKLEFAPMFKINRLEAKNEENMESKNK